MQCWRGFRGGGFFCNWAGERLLPALIANLNQPFLAHGKDWNKEDREPVSDFNSAEVCLFSATLAVISASGIVYQFSCPVFGSNDHNHDSAQLIQ
jgi:hypothetical protein